MSPIRHRGEYGFDGNLTGLLAMIAVTVGLLAAAVALARAGLAGAAGVTALVFTLLLSTIGFGLHTTRRGKFLVWAEILDNLDLRGDERVLDVGCGRGAILAMVAERLPRGRIVGIDLWTTDQSSNRPDATERNLIAEGVRERCEIVTGDMRSMPFPNASFEVVVSSLAIHNIRNMEGRAQAIREIARVLAPGGRMALADLAFTLTYARTLTSLDFVDVRRRRLGWRFWWGLALPATTLVSATKAAPPNSTAVLSPSEQGTQKQGWYKT